MTRINERHPATLGPHPHSGARRTAVVKWFAFVILPIVVVVLTGVATWLALIWLSAAGMLRALAQLALGRL
jgi:hypothetical protein